jgi:pyruvate formate lyase activating enzyme
MKKIFLLLIFLVGFKELISSPTMKEAMFYKKLEDNFVQCNLCFRNCTIPPGKRGFCGVRENREGKLYSLVYSAPCAIQIDPIEKEPSFHMLPGSKILCIGTAGCNFRCKFCHNWHMSFATVEETHNYPISPQEIIDLAKKEKCQTVSFTYNEPTVFYELMLEVMRLAKREGLKTLFHTNGAMNEEPLRELLKYTDSVTVDLKGFTQDFYKNLPEEAFLEPVLRNLKIIKEMNKHLEIVNLVIPTANDDEEDFERMCLWIKENLGQDTPLHINRFSPTYKFSHLPSTPIITLERLKEIADRVGLRYVYIGNAPGHKFNSTYCPVCKNRLIHRIHFSVLENNIKGGLCKFCRNRIPGIWD